MGVIVMLCRSAPLPALARGGLKKIAKWVLCFLASGVC